MTEQKVNPLVVLGDDSSSTSERILALAAVAELVEANDRTIKAFEALGKTDGFNGQIQARRECERALVAQKAALAPFLEGRS